MVFHWNLNDNKSLQVSRTLLSILADFCNTEVWTVSICPLISKSSSPLYQSFGDYINIIIIEFFPSAFADGFITEAEWQQVSSSLHNQ